MLFTWNDTGEYKDIRQIWKGTNPSSGEKLIVKEGMPEGYAIPDLDELPEEFSPGIGPDEYEQIAKRLLANL